MNNVRFQLGLATGVLFGIIISILLGTLVFNMHLNQMREMRHTHQKVMAEHLANLQEFQDQCASLANE